MQRVFGGTRRGEVQEGDEWYKTGRGGEAQEGEVGGMNIIISYGWVNTSVLRGY